MKTFKKIMGLMIVQCIAHCNFAIGQDAHLSQFDVSSLYLNAGMTGMYQGNYRAHITYRNQWSSFVNNPWTTSVISYDMPFEKFGFGGFIVNNSAGVGGFNSLTVNASAAYEITQDPKLYNHLSVGLQLGFIHKNFDPANYVFDNQYSGENGGGFDNNLPIGETFEKTAVWMPESNMGIYYYNSNQHERLTGFGGISLLHLTGPKESFLTTVDTQNNLPRRVVVHGGAKYKFNNSFLLKPMLLYMRQQNVTEINFGVLGYYDLSSAYQMKSNRSRSSILLIFGASYRYMDAAILQMGIFYSDFEYRFSYDINTSALSEISQGKGGFELSIIYKKPLTRKRPSIEIF